jgi:predicted DsbA family dithiol-disulfide isomerase
MQVEIWSDVVCPWCYLGTHRLHQALAQFEHRDDVEVHHRSFQLDPTAAPGTGETVVAALAARYGRTPAQVEQMQAEMTDRAAADGLVFELADQRTGNTFDAHRLLHLAAARGREAELVDILFRAHFSRHRSVFDHDSLADLAADAGLDRVEAAQVLAGDEYGDAVRADLAQAQAYGITGVPYFVIDARFGISGAQPTDVLLAALEQTYEADPH